MKKRHQQKLVGLSILLLVLWNMPFIAVFNTQGHILGFPILYAYIFICWALVVFISYLILRKHYE